MRSSRPARLIAALRRNITTVRENVPVMALAGIAFGASYGHISKLCGEHGQHGWVQYASAGVVDLLCIMGAEERQRDKRVARPRRGWVSWPAIVLVIGIVCTLASNLATAEKSVTGYFVAALPAGALLLAVSILERRTSHATVLEAASTALASREQPQGSGTGTADPAAAPAPVPEAVPVSASAVPASVPVSATAEPSERTFDDLLAEARAYRDELAAAGAGERPTKERLRLRLGVASGTALELARALRKEDQGEAPEASGAVG